MKQPFFNAMEIRYVTTRFEFESALAELWTIEKLCCDFETTGLDARVHEPRLLQLCSTKEDEEDRVVYVIDLFKCKNICLLYTSPSPRDYAASRMPSSA